MFPVGSMTCNECLLFNFTIPASERDTKKEVFRPWHIEHISNFLQLLYHSILLIKHKTHLSPSGTLGIRAEVEV